MHILYILAESRRRRQQKGTKKLTVFCVVGLVGRRYKVYQTTGRILKFIRKDEEFDGKWTNGRKTGNSPFFFLALKMANKSYSE